MAGVGAADFHHAAWNPGAFLLLACGGFLLASRLALWRWDTSYFGNRSNKRLTDPLDIQIYVIYQAARSLQSGKRSMNRADPMDHELVSDTTFRLILDSVMTCQYGEAAFPRAWEIGL